MSSLPFDVEIPCCPSPAIVKAKLERVAAPLVAYRWRSTEEKDVQRAIGDIFRRERIAFEAEHRLSAEDRVDFLVDGGLAVEVKLKHASNALLAQIHRYAKHDSVAGILVVTTSHRLAAAMPSTLLLKPVVVARLRSAL